LPTLTLPINCVLFNKEALYAVLFGTGHSALHTESKESMAGT
jgi:hypothetical protein